jgi:hypothetical protein
MRITVLDMYVKFLFHTELEAARGAKYPLTSETGTTCNAHSVLIFFRPAV